MFLIWSSGSTGHPAFCGRFWKSCAFLATTPYCMLEPLGGWYNSSQHGWAGTTVTWEGGPQRYLDGDLQGQVSPGNNSQLLVQPRRAQKTALHNPQFTQWLPASLERILCHWLKPTTCRVWNAHLFTGRPPETTDSVLSQTNEKAFPVFFKMNEGCKTQQC